MFIHIFNGIVYGALLIVMCSGLALIYGLRRVVNFAHGSLYMLGAYIGYSAAIQYNFWVALVAAPAIMAAFGVALDRWGFRLLQDRDPLTVVLVTFGLLLIIEDGVQSFWGKANLSVAAPPALASSMNLFGHEVPAYRVAVIGVGLAVALGL
ncbi:MAG: branched-chain amino acid ABC transporter permease, partial [Pseudomonadota bacterium]